MKSISKDLWFEIEKLLPKKMNSVGRPEFCAKRTLEGIFFVLKTGCQWHSLPEKYGKSSTVHGKFMRWCKLGIFKKILIKAREYYRKRNSKNSWFAFDTLIKKAPFAEYGGPNPTDRAKQGIKHSLLVDKKGAPLFVDIAAANVHDSNLLKPIIATLRKSKHKRTLAADSAFDAKFLYDLCNQKNITLDAATNSRRSKNKSEHKPKARWIVERTLGWLSWLQGLKTCWAKSKISHLAFLQIACSIQLFKMGEIFV